ncbi:MAG: AAA family ATPase [Planctomycetota bacterium]
MLSKDKLESVLAAFEKWFAQDDHFKHEDVYAGTITEVSLKGMSDDALLEFFHQFVGEGGKIQSGGHRTKNQFIEGLGGKVGKFRDFILDPFSKVFDAVAWLKDRENYPFFGIGIATIYLNRVDKHRYPVLNKKTEESLAWLGYELTGDNYNKYPEVGRIQAELIKRHPDLNNYYKVDALNQFIVGEIEGRTMVASGVEQELIDLAHNYRSLDNSKRSAARKRFYLYMDLIKQSKRIFAIPCNWDEVLVGDAADLEKKRIRNEKHENRKGYTFYVLEEGAITDTPVADERDEGTARGSMGIVSLLNRFRQIILYGPPGTGKTHTAIETVQKILGREDVDDCQYPTGCGEKGAWALVQFHPSYNYEDFVRGITVKTEEGGVTYQTEDKLFARLCLEASANGDKTYILIIDEINRANLASVLGELIYALEYRGEAVKLPYSINGNDNLSIPKNLLVIGTMNTADRSIGHIDYALRRRFVFVPCLADRKALEVFYSKGQAWGPTALTLFDSLTALFNERAVSPDYSAEDLMPGHTYFMAKSNGALMQKMEYQVLPLLFEYFSDGILEDDLSVAFKEIIEKADHE